MSEPARPSFLRRLGRTLKGFLLWDYERGSWQYDVMVALILLFIFLMPARFFHDQPVFGSHLSRDFVRMDEGAQGVRYRLSAQLLASYDADARHAAEEVLTQNFGHPVDILRIQEVRAQDGAVVWYDVWVRE